VLTPEQCAERIVRLVRRRRREVVHPLLLRAFYWADAVVPGMVRWLSRT